MSAPADRVLRVSTALYRRYRPDTFADVIGQEHVTAPLMTALGKDAVSHAYLFSGPRGCGKTTSARILARCLNCHQGPTGTPCGQCESCRDLATGGPGSLDVIEIDAASHGGVDDARDLRERATFAPVRDRYKIFIIDEAHMVTPAGFNALLKIVEEPPEHIKFIFATTEPDKVIGTIRSRTHHYPFRLVPPEPLLEYLQRLCSAENVATAPGVLQLVLRAGGGSVRDTLSVLDQLIAGADTGGLNYERAVALLGFTHATLLDEVVDAVATLDGNAAFSVVDRVVQSGQDPRRFVEDLLERLRDVIIVQSVPENPESILRAVPADQIRSMQTQAQKLGAAELSRAADTTATALTEMVGATSPRLHLELLMARLLLPHADQGHSSLAARLERLERRMDFTSGAGVTPVGEQPSEVETAAESRQQRTTANQAATAPRTETADVATAAPAPDAAPQQPEPAAQEPVQPESTEPAPSQPAPTGLAAARAAAARSRQQENHSAVGAEAHYTPPVQEPVAEPQPDPAPAEAHVPAAAETGREPQAANSSDQTTSAEDAEQLPPAPESRDSASGQWPSGMPEIPARKTPPPAQADGWVTPGVGWEGQQQPEAPQSAQQPAQPQRPEPAPQQTTPSQQPAPTPGQPKEPQPTAAPQNHEPAPWQATAPGSAQVPSQPQQPQAVAAQPEPAPQQPAQPQQSSGGGDLEMMRQAWPDIVEALKSHSRLLWMTVKDNSAPAAFDGRGLTVTFSNDGARASFLNRGGEQALGTAVEQVLGMQVALTLTSGPPPAGGEAPPKAESRPEPEPSAPAPDPQEASHPVGAWQPSGTTPSWDEQPHVEPAAEPYPVGDHHAAPQPPAPTTPEPVQTAQVQEPQQPPQHSAPEAPPAPASAPSAPTPPPQVPPAQTPAVDNTPPAGPAPVPAFARRSADSSPSGSDASPSSAHQASPQAEGQDSSRPMSRAASIRQRIAARHSAVQEPPPDPYYDTSPQESSPPPDWAEAAPPVSDDDVPSDDDIALESSGVFGRRAIERILGGVLIEEQQLNGPRL